MGTWKRGKALSKGLGIKFIQTNGYPRIKDPASVPFLGDILTA
jgi:hypothetical protein